jgi:hypothetical protein
MKPRGIARRPHGERLLGSVRQAEFEGLRGSLETGVGFRSHCRRLDDRVDCLARVHVRLQNVSKTAAELRGLARNSAEVRPRPNLPLLRANRRIGVRRRPVSNFASRKFESRTPRHSKALDSPMNSGGNPGPPAFRVTSCHSHVTALRRGKPEASGPSVQTGSPSTYADVSRRFELLRAAGSEGVAALKIGLEKAWDTFRAEIGWKVQVVLLHARSPRAEAADLPAADPEAAPAARSRRRAQSARSCPGSCTRRRTRSTGSPARTTAAKPPSADGR